MGKRIAVQPGTPEAAIRVKSRTVVDANGCWVWQGATVRGTYGKIWLGSRTDGTRRLHPTHRVMYEALVGPVPAGLVLDHLCRNTSCCNPDHLEAVTGRTNILRGVGWSGRNAQKTHCVNGHEFTPENTYAPPYRPSSRMCRTCRTAVGKNRAR